MTIKNRIIKRTSAILFKIRQLILSQGIKDIFEIYFLKFNINPAAVMEALPSPILSLIKS